MIALADEIRHPSFRRHHRRPRQRPARPHVRHGRPAHGLPRPHLLARQRHAHRPGRRRRSRRRLRRPRRRPRVRARRQRRHLRVRKRPRRHAAAAAEFAPGPPGRPRAAHRRSTACARRRSSPQTASPSPRSRRSQRLDELRAAVGGARVSRRPQDRRLRLRRQGAGQAHTRRPTPKPAIADAGRAGDESSKAFVDFEREVSVVAARGVNGAFCPLGRRSKHPSPTTFSTCPSVPADVPPHVARRAVEIARAILEKLDVVGVLCVEFFLTRPGDLVVNELAPRPHNTGHLTFDARVTSQFEQQLRAVCGLPLGSTASAPPRRDGQSARRPLAAGEPELARRPRPAGRQAPPLRQAHPAPGRKMGHLTAFGDTPEEAATSARQAFEALAGGAGRIS